MEHMTIEQLKFVYRHSIPIYIFMIEFCAIISIIDLHTKVYGGKQRVVSFYRYIHLLIIAYFMQIKCQSLITNYSIQPLILLFHLFIIVMFLMDSLNTLWNKEKITIQSFLMIRRYAREIIMLFFIGIYILFLLDLSAMADNFVLDKTKYTLDLVPIVEFYIIIRLYIFYRFVGIKDYPYIFFKLILLVVVFTIIELLIKNYSCDLNRHAIIIYLHIFTVLIIYYALWGKSIKILENLDDFIITKKQKNIMRVLDIECTIYYLVIFIIEMVKIGAYPFCIK